MLQPISNRVPTDLKALPRWVVWREEGGKKPPFSAKSHQTINIMQPTAGAPFEVAMAAYQKGNFDGIGFILVGDGICGVDLDDCVIEGVINPAAQSVLQDLGANYAEFSPSGCGVRAFGFAADLESGANGFVKGVRTEVYSKGRYLTVTGHVISGLDAVLLGSMPGFEELAAECRGSSARSQMEKLKPEALTAGTTLTCRVDSPLVAGKVKGRLTQETKDTQVTQDKQVTHDTQASGLLAKFREKVDIYDLPSTCAPTEVGQRQGCIFQFARYFASKIPDASEADLYMAMVEWHSRFVTVIGTKDFTESWTDMLNAWSNFKYPWEGTFEGIVQGPLPELPEWMQSHSFGPLGELLLRQCMALANYHAPKPFFLGCREAGASLECNRDKANSLLNAMVLLGYLDLVAKGHTGLSSQYRIGSGKKKPQRRAGHTLGGAASTTQSSRSETEQKK